MPYPISWLKDFVDINLPILELAHLLTMAGMEVEEIHYVGWPLPKEGRGETVIMRLPGVIPSDDNFSMRACSVVHR